MGNNKAEQSKIMKICIGLSGGVDSAVSAALLKDQGFEVIGVYMKNWNNESPILGERPLDQSDYRFDCPWYNDYLDAKRVALKLEIPFVIWDFRLAYKIKVFDHFMDELAKGRTPNPDIYCNSLIKFEDWQNKAITDLGVQAIATGHYARLVKVGEENRLQIPMDSHKDQTYFLYRLNQEQLAKVIFPLAELTKPEVRTLAIDYDLPNKFKKDSQGICFIGELEMRQFVSNWLAPKEGAIIDSAGREIGRHQGAHLYTIGERVPVDNALVSKFKAEYKHAIPHFYVSEKSMIDNTITAVPNADNPALLINEVTLEDFLYSPTDQHNFGEGAFARVRHGGQLIGCRVDANKVKFNQPVRAVAPGQHVVLYDRQNIVLGGGVVS